MPFLPFTVAGIRYLDVEGNAEATERVNAHWRKASNAFVYRRKGDTKSDWCSKEVNARTDEETWRFAAWDAETRTFVGMFALYRVRTASRTRKIWTVSAMLAPMLYLEIDAHWWAKVNALSKHLLTEELKLAGRAGSVVVSELRMPDTRDGDKAQHEWHAANADGLASDIGECEMDGDRIHCLRR